MIESSSVLDFFGHSPPLLERICQVVSTDEEDRCAGERVALKVATPAAAWEFAAARVISDRVPARYASLFLPARCIFLSSGWDASSTAVEAGAHTHLWFL